MVIWWHVALAGLWGGLLAVERRAFLQAMFSRPLVAATGMGLLLDDLSSGLYVGLVLELFHLGSANLGAALPENDTLAAAGTAAAAASLTGGSGGSTPAIWSLAILLFIGLGRAGRSLDRALEQYSSHLVAKAFVALDRGDLRGAVNQHLWGIWPHFVLFGLITSACAVIGFLLAPWVESLPLGVARGLAWAYPAMASVAAAIAARGSHARQAGLFAGAAAALVIAVTALATLQRSHS
ncbi:MAG TPA: PTS sugar transporter subunit IIC [Myxococcaceae bacterium]|nr:PTS sugar transporter subunit IIC [Myxococcaceae bacterium]